MPSASGPNTSTTWVVNGPSTAGVYGVNSLLSHLPKYLSIFLIVSSGSKSPLMQMATLFGI